MRNLPIAYGNSCFAKRWPNKTTTFDELCERLKNTTYTTETVEEYPKLSKADRDRAKDRGGFVGGQLKDNRRKRENVVCRSMLTHDADHADKDFIEKFTSGCRYAAVLYTTHGHTPESPRVRIIVPLARDVTPDEFTAIGRYFSEEWGIDQFDECSYRPQQLMYWPTTPANGEYIFRRAIDGESFSSICRDLNARGLYTIFGKKWTACRITEILINEKYIGDSMLQKKYVNNHIDKKLLKNKGELPMYYAEDTHEAIIDKETFEKAQEVVRAVKEKYCGNRPPKRYPFSSIIKCGLCGENFKRVTRNGKVCWNCRTFQEKGKAEYPSKQIPEGILESVTAEVLGLDSFDGEIFKERIERIEVSEANRLNFVFKDGHSEERTWKDRSRSESWTPEMREAARQRALKQRRDK
jgi:hypothetical protein